MAFIDKKTRVVDMQLTARGRELLASGQLRIVSYAFSDEMVDYSGSLNQSLKTGVPLDTVIYRNHLSLQADQMDSSLHNRDLQSFLYTAPVQRDVLPSMNVTFSSGTLQRRYKEYTYKDFINNSFNLSVGKFAVLVKMDDTPNDYREEQYVAEQDLQKLDRDLPTQITLTKR